MGINATPIGFFGPERGLPAQFAVRIPEAEAIRDMSIDIGYDPTGQVTPKTAASVARLAMADVDSRIVDIYTPSFVTADVAAQVDLAVNQLEAEFPNGGLANSLFDIDGRQGAVHPVGEIWFANSKRAHALIALSDPRYKFLGGYARENSLLVPMFSRGRNAIDVLHGRNQLGVRDRVAGALLRRKQSDSDKVNRIVERTTTFLETELAPDRADRFGLTSKDYLAAVPDSIAIQKREGLATHIIGEYAKSVPEIVTRKRGLRVASLACGAGNMMCQLVPALKDIGIDVESIKYYDHDPVALAIARAHAEGSGIGSIVETRLFDIIRGDSSEDLKDVDIKELLGLFEYLDILIGKGPLKHALAQDFLRSVGEGMKPGSMILFGNMVQSRPHQVMFNQVWPKLYQRSPEEVVNLIESAGYPRDSISVYMSDDGVYAEYKITIPDGGLELPRPSAWQDTIKRMLVGVAVKEY